VLHHSADDEEGEPDRDENDAFGHDFSLSRGSIIDPVNMAAHQFANFTDEKRSYILPRSS
jgi:hypothetical protein